MILFPNVTFAKIILIIKVIFLASFVVISTGYPLATVPENMYYHALFIPTFVFFLYMKQRRYESISLNAHNSSYIILLFLGFSSFFTNLNIEFFSTNVKYLLLITFAFLFTKLITFSNFIKYYIITMKFIVIVSLIFYTLFSYIEIPVNLPVFTNINGVEYYNGIIFFIIKGFGSGDILMGNARNIGIFWEPGVFSTFIVFAVVFEIVIKEKVSKINLLIFSLGLITTFSTSGYLMFILILFLIFQKNSKGIKSTVGFTIILGSFIVLYMYFINIVEYLYNFMPTVFGKFLQDSASVESRLDSPLSNLHIFLQSPLYGSGLGKVDDLFVSMTDAPQTSTSTYYLAAFGIFGILYVYFFVYGILKYKSINIFSRIILLIIILLQMNKESHLLFSASYIIMFYFLKISSLKSVK